MNQIWSCVQVIREAVGPDMWVSVDANQKWGVEEAIAWMEQLRDFNLTWIEEPTSPDDILGHAKISRALKKHGKQLVISTTGVGQNSVPGFGEFHFCLNLPGKFSQPGTGILPEPCTLVELRPWSPRHRRGHGRDVPEPGDVQAVPAVGRHAVLPDRLRPNEVCHEVAILSSCTSALFSAAA